MLKAFLDRVSRGQSLYITDVRNAFQARGKRPFHLHVTLYDGSVRRFPLLLPETNGTAEETFVSEYVCAFAYNLLSALGGVRLNVYLDRTDRAARALAEDLSRIFQLSVPKAARTGYGKCLNVNERVLSALFHGGQNFSFGVGSTAEEPAAEGRPEPGGRPVFAKLPALVQGRMLLGMDVGGTDVKLAVSADGRLVLKEFDWLPSACTRAEELTAPLLLLTRLLRAAGSLYMADRETEVDWAALDRRASMAEMEQAAGRMERAAGDSLHGFDAIGLSFPDVVIQNRIVGGETPKTQGLRHNSALDYETQFAQITALNRALEAYTVPGGPVLCANDGPMAAFTAAVEQAAAGAELSRGFFAHSLGTDLGTGWVRSNGSIPDLPLEVYNFIIDLGSRDGRAFPPEDARSVRSTNTGLPGALQKYAGQAAVFRLAAARLPRQAPELWQDALSRNLFRWEGERLIVPTSPADMRKDCLEYFMERAAAGQPDCQEIFRQIGEHLAVAESETEYIICLSPGNRTLFGRLVKDPACFHLLCQGAARRDPGLRLAAADGNLANTPLMRQLACCPGRTVAQFAQAVGAVYYGCLGLTAQADGGKFCCF